MKLIRPSYGSPFKSFHRFAPFKRFERLELLERFELLITAALALGKVEGIVRVGVEVHSRQPSRLHVTTD
jgi:hypothetical protein